MMKTEHTEQNGCHFCKCLFKSTFLTGIYVLSFKFHWIYNQFKQWNILTNYDPPHWWIHVSPQSWLNMTSVYITYDYQCYWHVDLHVDMLISCVHLCQHPVNIDLMRWLMAILNMTHSRLSNMTNTLALNRNQILTYTYTMQTLQTIIISHCWQFTPHFLFHNILPVQFHLPQTCPTGHLQKLHSTMNICIHTTTTISHSNCMDFPLHSEGTQGNWNSIVRAILYHAIKKEMDDLYLNLHLMITTNPWLVRK